jgi:transcription initiation factor TFIIIB Brf1 subunit/transcription initiation factor TFIIB
MHKDVGVGASKVNYSKCFSAIVCFCCGLEVSETKQVDIKLEWATVSFPFLAKGASSVL